TGAAPQPTRHCGERRGASHRQRTARSHVASRDGTRTQLVQVASRGPRRRRIVRRRPRCDAAPDSPAPSESDAAMRNGVVLLDKDGVLIENVPLSADPDRMRLMDGAVDALVRLAAHGFRFGVVTNQAGIALGCYPEHALVA